MADGYTAILRSFDVGVDCRLTHTGSTAVQCCKAAAPDNALEDRVVDKKKVAERTATRRTWGTADEVAFGHAREHADPLSDVHHRCVPFRTRAALKFADIDQEAHVVRYADDADDGGLFYFIDLCGAPGSWTEYVLWALHTPGFVPLDGSSGGDAGCKRVAESTHEAPPRPASWYKTKRATGWGISLSTDNPTLDWQLNAFHRTARTHAPPIKTFCLSGETGDGDITSNANLVDVMLTVQEGTEGEGVHLAMGDGGLIYEKDFEGMETNLRQVILGEVLGALLTLREGGDMVLKVLDINTTFSIHMMYILFHEFEAVDLVKPLLSRPANSERYFVGKRRKRGSPWALPVAGKSPSEVLEELKGKDTKEGLTATEVCQMLFAVNDLEGTPDQVEGFVAPECVAGCAPFVEWLGSRNHQHLAAQMKATSLLSEHLKSPPADPAPQAALRKAMSREWWERSRLSSFPTAAGKKAKH